MRILRTLLVLVLVFAALAAAALWLGVYNVAADVPHWDATHRVLDFARERSIAAHAAGIEVPDLADPERIRSGAGNYAAMCAACHLSPDAPETELSIGLYPRPPRWDALAGIDPREAYWVIKHGLKASGMPAWGRSMSDEYLWGLVAFVQQLGTMTAAQYSAQVAASPGHSHGGGERGAGAVEPGTTPPVVPAAATGIVEDPGTEPPDAEDDHDATPHEH